MKKVNLFKCALVLYLLLPCSYIQAQVAASTESLAGIGIAGDYTTSSESVYIGPGDYVINGNWNIYAKNVWISPDANISGTGTISFYNPVDAGGTAGATLIDGNNRLQALDINLVIQNNNGAALTQIVKDGTLTGWADNTAASSLYIGKDLNLAVSGAHVALGSAAGDLTFDSDATISGYAADRFVVTNNSVESHLVKESYTGTFVFPVGIAPGDYTPATIDNTAANAFSVSVQDYAASASLEGNTENGIGRTWNIFAANASANSVLTLQHNTGSEQVQFNRNSNFITQYGPVAPNMTGDGATNTSYSYWQSNQVQVPVISGSASSVSKTYTSFGTSVTDPLSFFSKSSNMAQPLPIELVSFGGTVNDCKVSLKWVTANEEQAIGFEVQYSNDGSRFVKIGMIEATNKAGGHQYDFAHTLTASKGYYRLRMLMNNQEYKYSNTVLMQGGQCFPRSITMSPNPTRGLLSAEGMQDGDVIRVYSVTGQLLLTQRVTGNKTSIDLHQYLPATYQVTVSQADQLIYTTSILKAD